ncbi:hypothetical protein [Psilogramma increta granulovirus]|uniref:Uncharacterized protein n=1 Tax=Psilogramma increta granulovirus TaxID=2953508 RepID=A0A977TNU5_9BBAC|nr:hypothetical protein [Psilogramma increta granulovirus]
MYYFQCRYDDLCEFEWSVLLSRNTLQLWLDVSCLRSKGFDITIADCCTSFSPVNIQNVSQCKMENNCCVVLKDVNLTNMNYEFYTTDHLLSINSSNDYYVTVLHQFLYYQLPKQLQMYLNHIKLVSLYDIKDYWNTVYKFNNVRKYWLLRWKIMCVMYKQTKNENELNHDKSFDDVESKKLEFMSCHNSTKKFVESLNENIKQQFDYMNQCVDDTTKLYVMYNFNKLLMGSVGLLELMVNWV